jgi:hypothetical protein
MTAVSRQATAADSHSQNCLQTLCFFSLLSLYLWWDNNWTTPACWKSTETVLHLNLGHFVSFFFVLCGFGLFYFSPLMRELQKNIWGTISKIGGWGTNTKIAFELGVFFIFYFFYIYVFSFISFSFFIFYFQSSLCLSNAFSAYGWIVHCLSLFISLKLFCLFLCFVFFYLFICFSLFL